MLELLIIGGGVHGTFLSHALCSSGAFGRDQLAVLDPWDEPLAHWHRNTRNSGMRFLRSPSSHNMDTDFHALRDFARTHNFPEPASYIPPYQRPSLELFDQHTNTVLNKHRLARLRVKGRAQRIVLKPHHVEIATDHQVMRARRVLIAVGRSEELRYPGWYAATESSTDPNIAHVFSPDYNRDARNAPRAPVIVGGGVTAAQLALALSRRSENPPVIVARHPVKSEQFDSNPCFIGPRCLEDFLAERDYTRRRQIITRERNPGTMPSDVAVELQAALDEKRITYIVDEVVGTTPSREGQTEVRLSTGPSTLSSDAVFLATGFNPVPPASRLIADLAARHSLKLAEDGYPIVDRHLQWQERVFLAGPLAELELGPACVNIIGAHHAARRLVPVFKYGRLEAGRRNPWLPLRKVA